MAETFTNTTTKRIAVVTGGNKGIGFEICKQLASNGILVVLTARDVERGNEAVEKLKAKGLTDVVFHQLDVTNQASIASLAEHIKTHFGRLDILVNNAGISGSVISTDDHIKLQNSFLEVNGAGAATVNRYAKQTYEKANSCLQTNYYGCKWLTEALIPFLEKSSAAIIVNVSSTMGQLQFIPNENVIKVLGDVNGLTEEKVDKVVEEFLQDAKEDIHTVEKKGWPAALPAYRLSKATLNAYTRVLANKYKKISINAVCPGFTKTDMNSNSGILTVEQGAEGPVKLALMSVAGPSGLFFERTEISTF